MGQITWFGIILIGLIFINKDKWGESEEKEVEESGSVDEERRRKRGDRKGSWRRKGKIGVESDEYDSEIDEILERQLVEELGKRYKERVVLKM